MSDTNQNRPTHPLFTVNGNGDNARWTGMGVAWATRDGKGFTLSLSALLSKVTSLCAVMTAKKK